MLSTNASLPTLICADCDLFFPLYNQNLIGPRAILCKFVLKFMPAASIDVQQVTIGL